MAESEKIEIYGTEFTHCNYCSQESSPTRRIKACTRCFSVGYCSKKCQRLDWPGKDGHKPRCRPRPRPTIPASEEEGKPSAFEEEGKPNEVTAKAAEGLVALTDAISACSVSDQNEGASSVFIFGHPNNASSGGEPPTPAGEDKSPSVRVETADGGADDKKPAASISFKVGSTPEQVSQQARMNNVQQQVPQQSSTTTIQAAQLQQAKPSQQTKFHLSPEAKQALREAVLSAIRHPNGDIDPACLQRAMAQGLPQQAIVNAAAVARERDRRNREQRILQQQQRQAQSGVQPMSSAPQQQPPSTSIFGTPATSSAPPLLQEWGKAFGAPAFSAFNAPSSTVGAFGSPAPKAPATFRFGSQEQQQTVGTAAVSYQTTTKHVRTDQIDVLQAITAMPQYEQKSFEELRVEDYEAGNKGTKSTATVGNGQLSGAIGFLQQLNLGNGNEVDAAPGGMPRYGQRRIGNEDRKTMLTRIEQRLRQKPDVPQEWLNKLPQMAKRMEMFLYRAAPSLDAYNDIATLDQRLNDLAINKVRARETRQKVKELEDFCGSGALSLDALRQKIDQMPPNSKGLICGSSCLHRACLNDRVTLEIVQLFLDEFPGSFSVGTDIFSPETAETNKETRVYPLHLACYNEHCPSSVIKLLTEKGPSVFDHLCCIQDGLVEPDWNYDEEYLFVEGSPLHYYLMRECNIDIDIVKMMIETHPGTLTAADEVEGLTALHAILINSYFNSSCEIVEFLLDSNPSALPVTDGYGRLPLHLATMNTKVEPRTVKMLLERWPDTIRQRDIHDCLPIHNVSWNKTSNDTAVLEVLKLLLDMDPHLVTEADGDGSLPIHGAACFKFPEFAKVLIDAYPESVKIGDGNGCLPIHDGSFQANVDTVKYFFELYPEGINMRSNGGLLPIHEAASGCMKKADEVIKYLLLQDPDCASKAVAPRDRILPLHLACGSSQVNLNAVKLLFDAHPEAILLKDEDEHSPLEIVRDQAADGPSSRGFVVVYLEAQLAYAHQAQNATLMRTPDINGLLPLHHALCVDASFGSVKLLVKGNPAALQVADQLGSLPLHIACEYGTVEIVRFLVELDSSCLNASDLERNSPLHRACRKGNCGIAKYLLEQHVPSISERNADDKLPVNLLCESQVDRESLEYIETIWYLLLAYPETLLHFI